MQPDNFQQYFYYPVFQTLSLLPFSYSLSNENFVGIVNFQNFSTPHFPEVTTIANNQELSEVFSPNQPSEVQGSQQVQNESRTKRRYRKRRVWLQKKFRCNSKGCKCKYSSKIALNAHKRKKHLKEPASLQ